MLTVDSLERLTQGEGAHALAEAMTWEAPGPAEVERLRRILDATTVSAALEVARARRSLRGRIAGWCSYWCDREGAAQASDDASAAWKAERFRGAGAVIDLCCGTGADLGAIATLRGAHNVQNALAASAALYALDRVTGRSFWQPAKIAEALRT